MVLDSNSLIIRVAASSPVPATAGAIAHTLREHGHAEMEAIGAAAVNQAVKALAVVVQLIANDGLTLACVPSFITKDIDGLERTSMRFDVRVTEEK